MKKVTCVYFLLHILAAYPVYAKSQVRLKSLVNIKGVRSNSLIGYGLVVGLAGTGDTEVSKTTIQSASKLFKKLGVTNAPEDIVSGNIASVIVTGELPPFSKNGDRVDLRLSTTNDSTSLAGGTLLMTPLSVGDGGVYVIGSGPVVVGQADGTGASVLTVASVPQGGVVEREFSSDLSENGAIQLNLKKPDFTTNTRLTRAINNHFRSFIAESQDLSSLRVKIPSAYADQVVEFISELEKLSIETEPEAVVLINERTGTIVLGDHVTIDPITIAHGELSIKVGEEQESSLVGVKGTTVGEFVETLNQLGVKPRDLISILQAVSSSGSLNGEIRFN